MASKNTPPVKTGKFTIRKLESIVGDTDLFHPLHRHDYYFILAVEKGSGIHEIDFVKYKAEDRSVFLLRPGQVHQLTLEAGATGYLLEFDSSFYQPSVSISSQRWKKATAKNYCLLSQDTYGKLSFILEQAFSEYTGRQDGFAEMISASLDLFFITWLRNCIIPSTQEPSAADYSRERFEEFLQLLEANIHREKTVTGYADMLSLSVYQLNSITKSISGKTVSNLINEQMLLEAKRHLLGTTAQVKDISFTLGYEDVSYFIRFFRKQTGYAPDAFRKNFR